MTWSRRPSNLQSFLDSTTPVVASQLLPKSSLRELNPLWYPHNSDTVEYFTLRDLWSSYDEWSAYGAGTPISIYGGEEETLVQYYVPYLSAIQIYTSSTSSNCFRNRRDQESEGPEQEHLKELSDTCSDDSESSDRPWRSNGCRSEDGDRQFDYPNSCFRHNSSDRLGHLHFQFFERSAPHARVPLMDKIRGLAEAVFPGLMTLRSVDLSPASWMAVAWYPIYHIPIGRTVKDLSACFLTYHTLSSSFQETVEAETQTEADAQEEEEEEEPEEMRDARRKKRTEKKGGVGLPLPPFGLATYKMMRGSVWGAADNGGDRDRRRLLSLFSAADSWLKQLRVPHHDFNYFIGIRRA